MKRKKKYLWMRKSDADAAQNKTLPIPTQIISNEEFLPPAQTSDQKLVEEHLIELADTAARRLNISRRQFLSTSAGMAAAFLAMNSVCRLRMPEDLMKRFGFKPLTEEVKEKILGLNAARVYGVDVKAKMNAIPKDYVTGLKEKYRAEGAQPSNTQYGWILG